MAFQSEKLGPGSINKMKSILFIDDDKAAIRYYLEELQESGFDVTHSRNPDEALAVLEKREPPFDLIILDSALPPGKNYSHFNTEQGLTTGNLIFQDIRKRYPEVPIVILTNFRGLDWIRKVCELPRVCDLVKVNVMPIKLVEIVQKMLKA
jgi:CheY-like chemotaxis protein